MRAPLTDDERSAIAMSPPLYNHLLEKVHEKSIAKQSLQGSVRSTPTRRPSATLFIGGAIDFQMWRDISWRSDETWRGDKASRRYNISKKVQVMSTHSAQYCAPWLKRGAIALGLSLVASQSLAERATGGPFSGMSGHWSGGGAITMADGATERIRCRATYAVHPAGTALNQSLRCASASYRLEISANVLSSGGAISGSWSEATRGVSGSISGRANGPNIQAHVTGSGFAASIGIRTNGSSQSVAIRPQGADVSAVSITMRKG
jgi:hypothetical protein